MTDASVAALTLQQEEGMPRDQRWTRPTATTQLQGYKYIYFSCPTSREQHTAINRMCSMANPLHANSAVVNHHGLAFIHYPCISPRTHHLPTRHTCTACRWCGDWPWPAPRPRSPP